jgi:hypothetical protein
VGAAFVVIFSPSFDHSLGLGHRQEPVLLQTLLPKLSVERFDERIIRGLSRTAEVELHAIAGSPPVYGLRQELGTISDSDCFRQSAMDRNPFQNLHEVVTPKSFRDVQRQALTAKVID